MDQVRGMLTLDQLQEYIAEGTVETILVVFTDLYGRFMGKRFDAEFFLEDAVANGTHSCDYLLTVDMEMEPVPGYKYANWERGYGDFHLKPDMQTLRMASWLDKTALVLCDVEDEKTHQLVPVAPRTMLLKQIRRLEELGYSAKAGSELEYYIFEDSYKQAFQKNYHGLDPMGWYIEDYHAFQGAREEVFTAAARKHLKHSGIPVENSKGEWGLGQHEINVRYAEILTMADRHSVFKQCLREVADQLGLSLTFMAKYATDQAGSSCHIHLSIWDGNESAMAGEEQFGPISCSPLFKWFLGGWIAHAPEMMVFYAPTVNSYKRYKAGSWAPTKLAWSHDNRTAGFRVVGSGKSLRIECRIPGADCNPYLAYTAALASGIDGIINKIEPPTIFEGDVYTAQDLPTVPGTLKEATEKFANSNFAKEVLGTDVVEHYAHFFRVEQDAYDQSVTDWEKQRYFERV
ncbi:MAG: glutamine synthetase family protein [Rhodothermales bacterium]